jgi:uncharacterized protein (DUF305 family)
MKTTFALVLSALTVLPLSARAENPMPQMNMDHGSMDHMQPAANLSPSTKAYQDANAKMHGNMSEGFTGDADVDFFRGMIPHHQGAVDMAKVELEFGKDPEARKMAEDIIKAQESEIAVMKAWLAKREK